MVQILKAADVPFAILGKEEGCTGDPARRSGNEYLFQELAATNVEVLNNYGVKKVLTPVLTASTQSSGNTLSSKVISKLFTTPSLSTSSSRKVNLTSRMMVRSIAWRCMTHAIWGVITIFTRHLVTSSMLSQGWNSSSFHETSPAPYVAAPVAVVSGWRSILVSVSMCTALKRSQKRTRRWWSNCPFCLTMISMG